MNRDNFPAATVMITSISNISGSSVALLFGTSGASPTDSASAATRLLSDATGHTDDVLKAGNAIGNTIEIASRMEQDAASADKKVEVEEIDLPSDKGRELLHGSNLLFGVKGALTTTYHADGGHTETFVGNFLGKSDEAYRQMRIDGLRNDQASLRNRTMLAAFENKTIQETDIAELDFQTGSTMTSNHYSDGSGDMSVHIDWSGVNQFREQYTELRDGVLYDKATGKFAEIGQNGSKFIYMTW